MSIIGIWAANRGLSISESIMKEQLGMPSFENVVVEKLDVIDRKLDILIQSPYRQAKMHLLEDNFEKCKDKLIEAISMDELNLPAISLYAFLLYSSGKIKLAVEYFEQIVRKFGAQQNVLSPKFIEAYADYINTVQPLRSIAGFSLGPSYMAYPKIISCSPAGIIVYWVGNGYEIASQYRHKLQDSAFVFYDWSGNRLGHIVANYSQIVARSEEYIVLKVDAGGFFSKKVNKIFRCKDASELTTSNLSDDEILKLFAPNKNIVKTLEFDDGETSSFSYAGAKIRTNSDGSITIS